MKHVAFFGDGEKTFALTDPMIDELERTTGHGIGAIFRRVQSQDFTRKEIAETIRLGLIGGGAADFEAAALVKTYVGGRPLVESVEIALDVLAARFLGAAIPDAQDETGQAAAIGEVAVAVSEADNG